MKRMTVELEEQQAEAAKPDSAVAVKLRGLRYEA